MPRYLAFLRAINVGGHSVKMEALRAVFLSHGFAKVETFIASGNVIFESASKSTASLQGKIETMLQKSLGYEVKTFLRSDHEVAALAQSQPFPAERARTAVACNIALLDAPLPPAAARKLREYETEADDFRALGREIYWLCQIRQSESLFFKVPIEKVLGARMTFRNLNTIRKLAVKYPPATAPRKRT